jgi:hypothetical protein
MRLTRRSVLGLGGLAAAAGLAGCSGVLGGPSGRPRDWQFDVGAVSETPNRFFGTVDHGRLYEAREHLPEAVRGTVAGMVFAEPIVEATVDAGAGEGTRLSEADDRVRRLADLTGDATVTAGARVAPDQLAGYRQADGPVGTLATGLRAGGVGLTVDGETSTLRLAGLYEDAASAEATDAVELVEGFAAQASDRAGIEEVEATDDGAAVVVTVTGETRALLDRSALVPPTG